MHNLQRAADGGLLDEDADVDRSVDDDCKKRPRAKEWEMSSVILQTLSRDHLAMV